MYSVRAVYGTLRVDNPHILYFGAFDQYKTACLNNNHKMLIDEMKKEFGQMKFDVVIGNPPYNKDIYLDFVTLGHTLASKYDCWITPAKWQAKETLKDSEFRNRIVPYIRSLIFYPSCSDIFEIKIVDGITIYLVDKEKHEKITIENKCMYQKLLESTQIRSIRNQESLLNALNDVIETMNKSGTIYKAMSIEHLNKSGAYMVYGNKTATEIIDEISLEENSIEIANAKIQHILQPDKDFVDGNNGNGDGTNGNNNGNNSNNEENNTNVQYRIISGTAWVDANENGQKDNQEQAVEDITAKLLDVTTNKYVKDSNGNDLEAKTTSTGFYSFDRVPKGQYLVVFEYDTTKYGLTTFEKQGVASTMTSKVINKNLKINNEEKNVATTEIINVDTENIANINIGLINAKTYDLQLDKYITKVTVQNNKTVTNEYNNQTLAKAEIDAKQVNSTTVVVEYTIRVTNKGDVTAYIKKIADYLSSDYKFSSELNKDWYQSGSDIYCTSLANEKLQPGESKEVKLTVIKQMKENNTGLINNTAEIAESYNELGLKDKNSTEGNKVKGENDMGSADLIISIRTGQVVTTVLLVISSIVILGVAVYYIRRLITHRNFI